MDLVFGFVVDVDFLEVGLFLVGEYGDGDQQWWVGVVIQDFVGGQYYLVFVIGVYVYYLDF